MAVTRGGGAKKTGSTVRRRTVARVGTRAKVTKKKKKTTTTTSTTSIAEKKENAIRQSLRLEQILMIGVDPQNTVNWNGGWNARFNHLAWRVTKLLGSSSSDKKAFIYFQEEYDNNLPPSKVPVAIVVICKNIPTLRTTIGSIQNGLEEAPRIFDQDGLRWEQLPGMLCKNVYVLKQGSDSPPLSEYAILPLRKRFVPTETQVRVVTVNYGGVEQVWDTAGWSASEYVDLLEDENGNDWDDEQKAILKGLLLSEKKRMHGELMVNNELEQRDFDSMVTEISTTTIHNIDTIPTKPMVVAQNLQNMKVYKVFPTGLPKQKHSIFGSHGGFALTNKVNRYIDADQYFVE